MINPYIHSLTKLILNPKRVIPLLLLLSTLTNLSAQEPNRPRPTDGMTFIAPPFANNQGSAVLNYPLHIPAGRQGMEPSLSVDYNSEGGNGWLGLGWDLSLPAITIDTRWGVPRYSSTEESESYFYDGQALFPQAHRGAIRERTTEQQFYPRIEGTFERIIRHGNNPNNYWWEVTDKDGTRFFYGGHPSEGMRPSATLATDAGAIVHWSLVEVIDVDGNFMRYTYSKVAAAGNNSSQLGTEIYPLTITYTGHGNEEGVFKTNFVRDRDLGEAPRVDASIDCRLGFKRVQADLLRRVEVYFQEEIVRAYRLEYTLGAFQKTLLQRIIEEGRDGSDFYQHDFEYYDDVRQNGNYAPYQAATNWTIPDDDILGDILNPIPGMNGETSAIGGAKSTNFNVGGAATVGPNDFLLFSKDKTAGGTYAYGNSSDEGLIAMVDINSDGLVDKMYRKNNALHYRPSLAIAGSGETRFGDERPIHGIAQFSTSTTSFNAYGAEGNPPFAYVGFEYTRSNSTNNTYFSDFNGDGLLDIAQNGTVWFNHLDANGDPSFTTDSGDTPSPISSGAEVDGDLFEIDPEELEEAIDQYPLHDVVRMWQAPFAGAVQVMAPVQLVEPNDPMNQSYDQDDGVRVAIQHNNTELWSAGIDADDYSAMMPTGVDNITVSAGDRLYFRVQSVFDGKNDQVSWSPTIDYLSFADTIALDQRDANNLQLSHYQAAEDFILSAEQEVGLPLNGTITINGNLEKAPTSDDLIVQVVRWREGVATILYTDTILAAETVLQVIELDVPVLEQDALDFQVFSDTQLDWQAIKWMPNVFYTDSPDANVFNPNGEPLFSFCPTVGFSMYNDVWRPAVRQVLPYTDTLLLKPILSFTDPAALNNSKLTLSVKGEEGILYKTTFPVNNYQNADTINLVLETGTEVFLEYHFSDWEMARLVDTVAIGVWPLDTIPNPLIDTFTVAYASVIAPESTVFGHLYRGWGQFEYNGNRDRANLPINQAELVLDLPETDPDEEIPEDPEELDGLFDPTTAPFLVMLPDAKTQCYLGYDEYTYVSADIISSSRLGEDNILSQAPASSSGLGLSAPNRTTVGNEYSVAGGLGFSVVTGTASKSWVDTEVTMDVLDFNGDRYPDIIAGSSIQYTASRGGYLPGLLTHNIDGHHAAKSEATGFTLGGSFVPSRTSNSGEPKGGSSNKRAGKAKRRSGKLGKNAKNGGNTAGEAIGINGTFSEDGDWAVHSWTDINGDGLVDKVKNDGTVALNYGYSFGPYEPWGFTNFQTGESIDGGGGLGLSLYNGSIAGGISLTLTGNSATQTLEDVNGDGFPDLVNIGENSTTVQLNTGTGFGSAIDWEGMDQIDEGSATGESVNAAFTVCIPIFFVKVCINPSTSIGRGVSKQIRQLDDVDGDGFPDLFSSNNDGELSVQRSSIGRTNRLRTVNRPLGVSFTFDYAPQGTTYDQPYAIWAMTSFEMTDGLAEDGDDRQQSIFSYSEGYHHRDERVFLGFGTVKETRLNTATNTPYSYYTQFFGNDNYYEQGLLEAEHWENAAAETIRKQDYIYEFRDAETGITLLPIQLNSNGLGVFPALVQQKESWADNNGSIGLSATRTYDYDQYGNLTNLKDLGSGDPRELLDISFSYHYQEQAYAFTTRDSLTIRDVNGIVRQQNTQLDGDGNVVSVQHYIDAENQATFTYQYDEYGNTTQVTQPPNVNGQQLIFSYSYDTLTHSYPITETDVYGQVKERKYNLIYGEELSFKDENGLETTTEIDDYGRVVQRLMATDSATSDYSFRYNYERQNTLQRLKVERFDPEYSEAFETYVFEDGLGRILQEQQTIEATTSASLAPSVQFRVSGQNERGVFGRAIATYYPSLTSLNNGGSYQSATDQVAPLRFTYDVLDRPVSMTTPDGDTYTMAYDFAATPSGISCLQTTITDPLGRETRLLHNVRGQLLAEAITGPVDFIWTEYFYNGASERTKVVDAAANETHYRYDGLGRLTQLEHPDGGLYDYTFDAAGNLLSLLSPAIRDREVEGAQINYFYDYDRLQRIDYPFNPQNQVRYTWGDSTSSDNRNGRVYLVEDASGAQELWYNFSGEVTKVVRTMIVNEIQQPTYVSEYEYDSWGRLKRVYYPDGEIAEYTFNRSGDINSLTGEKEGHLYEYVQACHYDKFGDRLLIDYGNGTQSSYRKAPGSNRFDGFTNQIADGVTVSNQRYIYDAMGHLLSMRDESSPNVNGARSQEQTFVYDEAYRMKTAEGNWEGPDKVYSYQMNQEVDGLYNISQYLLRRITTDTTDRSQAYVYEGDQPHFPTKIGDQNILPNPNGNQQERSNGESFRLAQYDEEDRLTALSINGYTSYYSYDADGRRAIKSHGPGSGLSLDATPLGGINHGERDYTLYVSPFLEVTNDSFRKHYYLEDIRIASKKGAGFFVSTLLPPAEQITAGNIDLADRLRRLRDLLLHFTADLGVPPGHPSLPFFYVDGGEEAVVLPQLEDTDPRIVPPPGWPAPAGPPDPAGPPGHPVWYAEPASSASVEAGYGYSNPFQTPEVVFYYYHYNPFQDLVQVSGTDGSLLEQWAYLPFGEVFVSDEVTAPSLYQTYRNYSLDGETGLYFSGSNYYDSQDLLWLTLEDKATANPYRSPYLFDQGQAFPGSNMPVLKKWADDNTSTYFAGIPEMALQQENQGGSFSDASFTILSGPQAGTVEIEAAESEPDSAPKKRKPSIKRTKKSDGKTGVVQNKGLFALRRQFRQETGSPEKSEDLSPSGTQKVDAATKRKHRQFVIRPGDWDGITVPGNRHFQFKPEVDEPVGKKHRCQANPRRVRFRLDRQ